MRTQSCLKCHSTPAVLTCQLHWWKRKKMGHKALGETHSTVHSLQDPIMQGLTQDTVFKTNNKD